MAHAAFAAASLKPTTTRSPSLAANVCRRSSAFWQLTRTTACQVAPLTMVLKTSAKQQAARVSAVRGVACGALDRCTVEASATRVEWRLYVLERAGVWDSAVHTRQCLEARVFGTCEPIADHAIHAHFPLPLTFLTPTLWPTIPCAPTALVIECNAKDGPVDLGVRWRNSSLLSPAETSRMGGATNSIEGAHWTMTSVLSLSAEAKTALMAVLSAGIVTIGLTAGAMPSSATGLAPADMTLLESPVSDARNLAVVGNSGSAPSPSHRRYSEMISDVDAVAGDMAKFSTDGQHAPEVDSDGFQSKLDALTGGPGLLPMQTPRRADHILLFADYGSGAGELLRTIILSMILLGGMFFRSRFVRTRTVRELFLKNGLDLSSKSTRAWPNIFTTKPRRRLVHFDDMAVLCQCLAHLHIWFNKQDFEDVENKDSVKTRLCLFYLASFAGSGKSHLCCRLAEVLDDLQKNDANTVSRLLRAAQRGAALPRPSTCQVDLLLTPRTVEWAKDLQILGVNFNSERWNLDEGSADGELALRFNKFMPFYLRILFFAVADLSDADAAEAVWHRLGKASLAALKSGSLTPADFQAAVVDLFKELCGSSAPYRPLILVIDELSKARSFCPTLYAPDRAHPDAPSAFRSKACELTNKVNGHVLVVSLDEALPAAEFVASGRYAQELVVMPPFPTGKLLNRTLMQLSEKNLFLNSDGQLATASAGCDLSASIDQRTSVLAAIVGADARFAIYLSQALDAAEAGATLSAAVTTAASEAAVTCANVWKHRAADVIVAHAICGAVVLSADSLASVLPAAAAAQPGAEPTWDQLRMEGLIQAIGGPTFAVKMPLYILWKLDESSSRGRPLRLALFNMVNRASDAILLQWQTWEGLWNNLEIVLAHSRQLVSRTSPEPLCVMYPSTSFFGSSLHSISVNTAVLPTRGETRLLPSLLKRLLSDDRSLREVVWRTPSNAAAIDAVRFVVDDDGILRVFCYQSKSSGVGSPLTWGDACKLVKNMRIWLAAATWTAVCRPSEVRASPMTTEQQVIKDLWLEMYDAADSGSERRLSMDEMQSLFRDIDTDLDDSPAVCAFVADQWNNFPATSVAPEEVSHAVSTVLTRAVFVVAALRPRGARFLKRCEAPHPNHMRNAVVLTTDDLSGHAGDLLSTVVVDCGRTPSSSFTEEPTEGAAE